MGTAVAEFHTLRLFSVGSYQKKVYATKPLTLSELEERIHTASSEVGEEMLQNAGEG